MLCIINYGLVLTPEELVIPPNPAATLNPDVNTNFGQERACFTLMTRTELIERGSSGRSHSEAFGDFAIGLDPIDARELGVVPVMYFYRADHAVNLPYEMLYRLRELRTLLSVHTRIEAATAWLGRECPPNLRLDAPGLSEMSRQPIEQLIGNLSPREARNVAELFDTERVPAWNMIEWIDIILNFFQTADSATTSNNLAYFQQREWRIVRLFGPHAQCHALSLNEDVDRPDCYPVPLRRELRGRLARLDRAFFASALLDRSYVLTGTTRRSFFDFVNQIVIPHAAVDMVADILDFTDPGAWRQEAASTSVTFKRQGERNGC